MKKLDNAISARRLLHHVLKEKSWDILKDNNIKESDFKGKARIVLEAIKEYYADSEEFPPHDYIVEQTNITWPSEVALIPAVKRFKEWKLVQQLGPMVDRMQNHLADQRPKLALDALKEIVVLGDLESDSKLLDVNETAQERYEEYQASKSDEIEGIIPPFDTWRDAILMFENGTVNSLLALQGRGKSAANFEPILTESGWKTHGTIEVNDKVWGPDGKLYPVVGVHPQGKLPVYRVSFSDQTSVLCSGDHLWKVYTPDRLKKNRKLNRDNHEILTLEEILPKYKIDHTHRSGNNKGQKYRTNRYSIPVNDAIPFPEKEYIINPELLGLLLGDGSFKRENITFDNAEKDVLDRFTNLVHQHGMDVSVFEKENHTKLHVIGDGNVNQLMRDLKTIKLHGCGSREKFIPQEYFTGSIEQRRGLLRGLLNTDGCIDNCSAGFSTYSEHLYDGVAEIARSLGFVASKRFQDRTSETSTKKYDKEIEYIIRISGDISTLGLSEKHSAKIKPRRAPYAKKITNIELEGEEECTCISVDSPDHLYITRDYIVTHNSWISAYSSVHAAYVQKKNVLLVSCENSTSSMSKRIDSLYANLNFGDLRAKMLDFRLEQKWETKSKEMEQEEGNIFVADRSLIRNIHDVYQQFIAKKPDFVVIDGAYKLSGVDFKESSALLQSICDYASLSKVPWLITSQLNEAANHAKTATERTYSARGNKGYTIDVATVLSITQSPELELLNNVVECNVDKIRENGKSGDFKKKFHLQMSMDFTTIKEFDLNSYEDEEILTIT